MEPRHVVPPSVEELQAYSVGKVDRQRITEIEAFLIEGPDCTAIIEAAPLDAFVRHLLGARELATKPAPPPRMAGYEIVAELGRGGMAVVYLARHLAMNRLVALKMLLAGVHAAPSALSRFRQEAETVARLQHPNIVQIYEVGSHNGLPYLALEYVEDGNLTQKTAGVPLTAQAAAGLVELLARAVDYAHQHGVIHRDLKPANVLLTAAGAPKLSDFGLARLTSDAEGMTTTGAILGTPGYLAPEQASSQASSLGPPTDVYGLGAILYHLLTGRAPVQAATFAEIIRQTLEAEPVRPRLLQPRIPRDLETICLKCLQKELPKRYATALALAEDLRRFQAGEPIAARPVGWLERGWRWCRRNGRVAVLLAAVLVTLLAGATVATVLAVLAQHHADRADQEAASARQAQHQSEQDAAEARRARDRAEKAEALRKAQLQRAEWLTYTGKIAQAQQAWKYGDGWMAWHHLQSSQPDLRSWEYDYLHTLFFRNQRTFAAHTGGVWCVAYRPDGQRLASASGGPSSSQSSPGAITVWDPATGQKFLGLQGHRGTIFCLEFSPDGQRLASADATGTLKIWDANTGNELNILAAHERVIRTLAFDRDGQCLATGSDDNTIKVWHTETGQLLATLKGHEGEVRGVAFGPKGRQLVSASRDGTVRFWNVRTGRETFCFKKHEEPVDCVVFSPDGRRLASAGQLAIMVWDADTGNVERTFRGYSGGFSCLAFHPDGQHLISSNWNSVIQSWDLARDCEAYFLQGHYDMVSGVACRPDGKQIASASLDGTVKAWKVDAEPELMWGHTLRETPDIVVRHGPLPEMYNLRGHKDWVMGVAFSRDSRLLASAGHDHLLKVWDVSTGKALLSMNGHKNSVRAVAFGPTSSLLVSASLDGTIKAWDATTGRELFSLDVCPKGVLSVAFSPDGKCLASAAMDGAVTVWDVDTRQVLASLVGHEGAAASVAFSPDGQRLASAGLDGTVRLWEWASARAVLVLREHKGPVRSVAFSHDGTRLASAGYDQTAKVWEAVSGRLLLTLRGHTNYLTSVAFSRDGKRLASGSEDKSVKLWDTDMGQEVLCLEEHSFRVTSVAFSPDGKCLVSASDDRSIKVWDAGRQSDATK